MRSLDAARQICEGYLPGLLDRLAEIPLDELESPDNPAIEIFRGHGGPGLVIPKTYAGAGAGPLDALAVTRALGAAAPSLAVATTMHHFSVATLFTLAESLQSSGAEWALLEGIAEQNLLVASGFSEGRPGQGILSPNMQATQAEGGYLINGSKKPCSLSRSMDLLTASVSLPAADGTAEQDMAVLLVPKDAPGLTTHPFWGSFALAGAESEELRLEDVLISEQQLMRTEKTDAGRMDALQTVGFIWFELLISASYLGMVSSLVERVVQRGRGSDSDRARLICRLESATLLLEGMARMIVAGETGNESLAKTLVARYAAQDALAACAGQAVELLGGMAFVGSSDVAYLAAASHGLSFHPPSRASFTEPFLDHMAGRPLKIV
ncbi:acyl-CoA dehydrogenase family protein [Streptomyces sp. NPDC087901]|uniref:acyl-CoA dehydrogenase family protein n=1 Tax=Streptomyces sp. NPDC087901 TaxID=3365818 RepID=UPI00382A9C52